jgi:hypothetical protein
VASATCIRIGPSRKLRVFQRFGKPCSCAIFRVTDFGRVSGSSCIALALGSVSEVRPLFDEQKSGMLMDRERPCG